MNDSPTFCAFDAYCHSVSLLEAGADLDADYVELMERFGKTFNGLEKPAFGGDVLFEPLIDTNGHEWTRIKTKKICHRGIRGTQRKKKGLSMKIEYLFPVLLILLDIGAAAVYFGGGDWRKVVYWMAAATLTFVVTF